MQVKIKHLHPAAKTPTYATDGAACFDLYAAMAENTRGNDSEHANLFDTGLAFEIPQDHVMLVFSRSGFGFKNDAHLVNGVGVIDSDYRGTVAVKYNRCIPCGVGDRIAQAMILPVEHVQFNIVGELSPTERGENGFGSTGA